MVKEKSMSDERTIKPNAPADFTPQLGNYKTLQPFRYWCQKVLPLVYDDSLSYYELLCKVVDYLNKTMEDVETLHGDVTSLHAAYTELQNYVNNYFSTLDVQAEINNKLDTMAKDGSLTNLIKAYIDPLVNEQNNKITVLENRMNTFTSLPDGSTSGDAELIDIRVPANGFNNDAPYPTAGDAVRGQSGALKKDLSEIFEKSFTWVDNIMFNCNGYLDTLIDTFSSAKIDVSAFNGFRIYITTYTAFNGTYGFYDEPFNEKNKPIKWKSEKNADYKIYSYDDIVPYGAKWLFVSCKTTNKNAFEFRYESILNKILVDNVDKNFLFTKFLTPVVTIVDDDTKKGSFSIVKEICDNNNIKCSFGCVWANIQNDESSLSLLKAYQQQGFHIMSHPDINNANWNINNPSYNLSLAEQQLIDCVTYLKSQGFIDCDHVVSPGGANSEPIQQMVSKWCPSMIGKNDNTSNHLFGHGEYDLRRIFIDNNHDFDYYKSYIDLGLNNNDWIIIGTHSWDLNETSKKILNDLIVYIKGKNISIETYNKVIRERKIMYSLYPLVNSTN